MKNTIEFVQSRPLDVICLGRLAVDLYAQQIGSPLEDVSSFAKYLGGSSANIAFGTARLGLKSAMLSKVGDDHMGRFLTDTLAKEGCDVSHVGIDPERLTALVMLGIKDKNTFPLIFYRENCADMAIEASAVDAAFIASSKALLITGTHFSTAAMHGVSTQALKLARANNVRTVLDIDYRPVLWGLSGKADGETRFVSNDGVTRHMQAILPLFDLVVGTEEEFMIAGGGADIMASLRAVRAAGLVVPAVALTSVAGLLDSQLAKAPSVRVVLHSSRRERFICKRSKGEIRRYGKGKAQPALLRSGAGAGFCLTCVVTHQRGYRPQSKFKNSYARPTP